MHRILLLTICLAVFAAVVTAACAAPVKIIPAEAKAWCRYLVPLPKSVDLTSKLVVKPSDVAVVPPTTADVVTDQACKELRAAIGQSAAGASATFKIEMVVGGPEADKLKGLKNSSQAYSITPKDGDSGLRLVALTSRGLYYAAKTLQQLVRAKATSDQVEMPLLTVTDWPDLDERGLWGGDSAANLAWMAERKMNVTENISSRNVTRDGRGHSGPKDYWINAPEEAPKYAVKVVPAVLHLELVSGPFGEDNDKYTLFDVYPMLKATNGGEDGVICYSRPEFANVIADWIVDLKSLPGVEEVSVWLTENLGGKGGCKCEQCKKGDRNVLEMRCALAGWRKAEERLGIKFPIRILTSEETRPSEKALFAELPLDAKLLYYDSLLTYTTGRAPMIDVDVKDYIKRGGWASPVPNLSAFVRLVNPFTCPDFSRYRLNDFVDSGCSGLLGYACMGLKNSRFLVEGAAEWGWNAKGRNPHEFALSWAVRNGLKDPEAFAAWNDLHAKVAWDVYGSDFPYSEKRGHPGPTAKLLRSGKMPPLGFTQGAFRGHWGEIKTIEQFDLDIANEGKALEMAKAMGIPEFYYETVIVNDYIRAMRAAYDLSKIVKNAKVARGKEQAAGKLMKSYCDYMTEAHETIYKWLAAVSGHKYSPPENEEDDTESVRVVKEAVKNMKQLASDMGLNINEF